MPGDHDTDGDVDLEDFAAWPGCMTGPDGGPYSTGCEAFDFEDDGDVDLEDFAGFQEEFTGARTPSAAPVDADWVPLPPLPPGR
jgi:hypothetical protein